MFLDSLILLFSRFVFYYLSFFSKLVFIIFCPILLLASFYYLGIILSLTWKLSKEFENNKLEKKQIFYSIIAFLIYLFFYGISKDYFEAYLIRGVKILYNSTEPNLQKGDFVLVNRNTANLKRGDFISFETRDEDFDKKNNIKKEYVKRLIGLPNEKIELKEETLRIDSNSIKVDVIYINGIRQNIHYYSKDLNQKDFDLDISKLYLFKEKFENLEHEVFINRERKDRVIITEIRLSENQYFVMGDNRDDSFDSRFFGPIEKSQITGKLSHTYFSINYNDYLCKKIKDYEKEKYCMNNFFEKLKRAKIRF